MSLQKHMLSDLQLSKACGPMVSCFIIAHNARRAFKTSLNYNERKRVYMAAMKCI